jgi:hypothetical protein
MLHSKVHRPTWFLVWKSSSYLVVLSIHLSLEGLGLPWAPLCTFLGIHFLQVAQAALDLLQKRVQEYVQLPKSKILVLLSQLFFYNFPSLDQP